MGHVHRVCHHPTTSYGIICMRWRTPGTEDAWCDDAEDAECQASQPEYLLVQRKDSLSFVEFMRGKYDLHNRSYLHRLFSNMTQAERRCLSETCFDELWRDLWCKDDDNPDSRNFNREYQESRAKFARLSQGYDLDGNRVSIASCIRDTCSERHEAEWGFPKGRRNVNENDLACALREFEEETGYDPRMCIDVMTDVPPVCEEFVGTNNKRYRHIYYLAAWCGGSTGPSLGGPCHEIRSVRWMEHDRAQSVISNDNNAERKRLLADIHQRFGQRASSSSSSPLA